MEIKSSEKYNYYHIDENIIMFVKKNDSNRCDSNEVRRITDHTHNTWQKDRRKEELIQNTTQGKLAEDMLDDLKEIILI